MGAGSLKWVWLGGEGGLPRVSLYRVDFCSNPKHVIMLTPLLAERLVPMNLPERAREFWSRLAPRGESYFVPNRHTLGVGAKNRRCVSGLLPDPHTYRTYVCGCGTFGSVGIPILFFQLFIAFMPPMVEIFS